MSDLKISELNPVTSPTLTDELAIVNGGETKKITLQQATQTVSGEFLGWCRYDDTTYTSGSPLTLADGVATTVPNNGGNVVKTITGNFYSVADQKLLGETENDVYMMTIAFKTKTPNANQTHLDWYVEGPGDLDRVAGSIVYHKGNDVEQSENIVFQYYTDADFVTNGAQIKFVADGGTADIYDIIYFIQRTQKY